jgi:outer membrane lipoprotein-sorting protein
MGGFSMVLSNLAVNPVLEKDPFQLVVPEGYTKTDEFAP